MGEDHPHHLVGRRAVVAGGLASVAATATFAPARAGTSSSRTFTGHFSGVGTPDWVYLPFRVPRHVRRIEVAYAYEKLDTGAGVSLNIIDIGIFDPSGHRLGDAAGFRGWSGGARSRFHLSRRRATPGYLPGPITPGTWSLILGPFTVLPPRGVDYTVTVTLHHGRPARRFRADPAPRHARGRGAGWYRGDGHTHTVHSDGSHTQEELARLATAAGLDWIASTDHNTTSAQLTWGSHVPDGLLVIAGEEVTTRAGHCVTFGQPAGAWIDWRFRPEDGQLGRFTDRVRRLGGIAIAAHPFAPTSGSRWEYGYDDVDAIEVWNGPWTLDDQTGLVQWHAMLVAGRYLPVIGSSDSHTADQTVGLPQTVVRASALSSAAIVAGVRGGHTWIAESSRVDLDFTASTEGRSASCGDRLPAATSALVEVRLRVRGVLGCLAQVIGPGGPVAGALADDRGEVSVVAQVPVGLTPFVRAEVRRLDGAPVLNPLDGVPALPVVALTNPIFLGSTTASP